MSTITYATTSPDPYPLIYKTLWRFGRIFLVTFLTTLAFQVQNITTWDQRAINSVAIASLTAGIVAVANAFRDKLKETDPESWDKWARKMPI